MRGAQLWKVNRSRVLRSKTTNAEDIIWLCIRNRRLAGFKFIRQAPIDRYFADFLCREAHLIVEVDGATHGEAKEVALDEERTHVLQSLGYDVMRVHNQDVYKNIEGVLEQILAALLKQSK